MKFNAFKMVAAAAASIALGLAGSATANTYLTQMDWSDFTGATTQNSSSFGQVTLTENDGFLYLSVELFGGLKFTDTGNASNHFPFLFNLSSGGPVVVPVMPDPAVTPDPNVSITHQHCTGRPGHQTCETIVDNAKYTYNPPPGPYNQSTFGDFNASFDCCGNGGGVNRPSPFDFTITAAGITFLGESGYHLKSNTTGFQVPGHDPGGWWFSADVVDGNGKTFLIAGRDAICTTCQSGTPEPNTWALMILGFGGAGAIIRRRRAMFA